MRYGFLLRPTAMALAVATVVGCASEAPTTSLVPDAPNLDATAAGLFLPPWPATNSVEVERLEVCKRYQNSVAPVPATTSFNFSATADGGFASTFDITSAANNVYSCKEVWLDGADGGSTTVSEPAIPGYRTFVTRIQIAGGVTSTPVTNVETNSATADVNGTTGQLVLFTNIEIGVGCTYTQGYWKTHSLRGPAPYDDGWLAIGAAGSDTPFYFSGKTWFELYWTPPASGNVYIQLAHQYMAAKLNALNGASTPAAVAAAISAAETFFNNAANTPNTVLSTTVKNQLKALATTLGAYNEGTTGPGHCADEAPTS